MRRCLIVIDMLRDFLEPGGALYCGDAAREIVPTVAARLREAREQGWPILHVCDTHAEDDAEFEMYAPHALAGSRGAEIIAEVTPQPGDRVIGKTRFSAFHETELDAAIAGIAPGEVEVLGVCTSICVLFTAEDLRNRGYRVVVHRDSVADFDPEAHAFALKHMMRTLGVAVIGEEKP